MPRCPGVSRKSSDGCIHTAASFTPAKGQTFTSTEQLNGFYAVWSTKLGLQTRLAFQDFTEDLKQFCN